MITEGDVVNVTRNGEDVAADATVLHVPVATGDAWGFRCKGGWEMWTTEGITIWKQEPTP